MCHGQLSTPLYDPLAAGYEAWFEKPPGREIFALELDCVRSVEPDFAGDWLEVGAGTGRFAAALGIQRGIDPSAGMLEYALRRGIEVRTGVGEDLPYADGGFDGVLLATVLPFLSDAPQVLRECRRVLRPAARLVACLVPRESPWGEYYAGQGRDGHEIFSHCRFFTCDEVIELCRQAGFTLHHAASSLMSGPTEVPSPAECPQPGMRPEASFVALSFRLAAD